MKTKAKPSRWHRPTWLQSQNRGSALIIEVLKRGAIQSIDPQPVSNESGGSRDRDAAFGPAEQNRGAMRMALRRALVDTNEAGWDGYAAEPVTMETAKKALAFVHLMPRDFPTPEILPTPSGGIAFDWDRTPDWTFTATIDHNGRMVFAGLLGDEAVHGEIPPIEEAFPVRIRDEVHRLYEAPL